MPRCPSLASTPTEKQPTPTLIRCLIASFLRAPPPFFRKRAPTQPSQEAVLTDGPGSVHHPLPGADEPLLVGGHGGPRHYSAGRQALLVFLPLTWVPTGAGVHPPALPHTVPPSLLWAHDSKALLEGASDWRESLLGLWVAEPLRASLVGLRETCFSQHSRDRLWKLFLEVGRVTEVDWSVL